MPMDPNHLPKPNHAALLRATNDLVLVDFPAPPEPAPDEVTVEMKAVGICGSDVHYWAHGRIGDFVVEKPMVLGHEVAGQVVRVGAGVKHLAVGDRVALEPGRGCGSCAPCKTGRYNLCPDMRFFATPPVDGALATYVNHAADLCFKLPHNVSYEQGAMCEPLSVGVYACRRASVGPGSSVLILGSGPIGIICMWVAKAFGAAKMFMTDVSGARLAAAEEMGATAVFNAQEMNEDALSDAVKRANGGDFVDAAIECCGFASATRTAINCTRNGGTVCLVGLHEPEMKLPIFQVAVREVDVKGIFRYANTYPTCISLLSTGLVDVSPLITHRFSIDQLIEGFTAAKTGQALKVMFNL